jgi:hypothetical protein
MADDARPHDLHAEREAVHKLGIELRDRILAAIHDFQGVSSGLGGVLVRRKIGEAEERGRVLEREYFSYETRVFACLEDLAAESNYGDHLFGSALSLQKQLGFSAFASELSSERDAVRAMLREFVEQVLRIRNDANTRLAAVTNFVVLAVALGSLLIASASFRDARKSGQKQEKSLEEQQATLQDQRNTLDASRKALDEVATTIKGEQSLLEASREISAAQLALTDEQRRRELEQPDVTLALYYTDDLSVQVKNQGRKVARDTLYQGLFWKLNKPKREAYEWANAKPAEVKYVRPGNGFAPTEVQWWFGEGGTLLQNGDRLFGYMTVQCPDCVKERIYWVYFEFGGEGGYSEGRWEDYSFKAEAAATEAERLLRSNNLKRMSKSSFAR